MVFLKCEVKSSIHSLQNGMEWNEIFGMEYVRCQNGIEDFKNGMEDNLPYFHINFILGFDRGYLQNNIYGSGIVIKPK